MEQDTKFRSSNRITCVIDRSGKTRLMTPQQAEAFLMANPHQVSSIHPASTQPFAATAGSGRPETKESDHE